MSSLFLSTLIEDSEQKLWIGTYNDELSLKDWKDDGFFNYKNNLKECKSILYKIHLIDQRTEMIDNDLPPDF